MELESPVHEDLCEYLSSVSGRGAFATHFHHPADALSLEVKGVGPIAFPVSKTTVRALRSVAHPARFGQGEATVLDRRIRDTWVIAKSRVKVDGRRWRAALQPALQRTHATLQLPPGTRLKAQLHDMLVYEEGQFFQAHRDAEKTCDMIGTLVVLLPSSFEGGESVVSHEGEQLIVRGASRKELTFLAFFADCEHEVRPVEKGHRIALTYELRLQGTPTAETPPAHTTDAIGKLVREHFASPATIDWGGTEAVPDRLVYLLDHEYTPRGLSWHRLKGVDASRAALLRQVAQDTECEVQLATAEVHEHWSCEPEPYQRGRYGSRHEWERDATGRADAGAAAPHPPLTELIEDTIVLGNWIDSDDQPAGEQQSAVRPGEACYSRTSDELPPWRLAHEGYMGNYGDTVERWYHRAAIVLWPRSRAFVVRGKQDAQWAAARVRAVTVAGQLEQATDMVRALLPHWPRAAAEADDALGADVLDAAHRLDDADLAASWVAPLTLAEVSVPDALASMVDAFGAEWLEQRFDAWCKHRRPHHGRPAFQRSLAKLALDLPLERRAIRSWFARRLAEEHAAIAADLALALKGPRPSHVRAAQKASVGPLMAVLRSSLTAKARRVTNALRHNLMDGAVHTRRQAWVADVLREAKKQMPLEELEQARLPDVGAALCRALKEVLASPPRSDGDWSMDVEQGCDCELCARLGAFLSAPERTLEWPIAKYKRQHVHRAVDMRELPVSHTTRRQGSPHTLVLRKTDVLLKREKAARATAGKTVAWLQTWPRVNAPAKHRPR